MAGLLLRPETRAAELPAPGYLSDSLSDHISSVTQQWGELGLNTAVKPADRPAMKLRIKDKEYSHGLGHHANGEIVVDLDGQFKTFAADLGIQWQGGQNIGSVVFQVFVDGKKAFDSGIVRENDPPRPVAISVEGASELRLVAGDAGDGITCDCADWADARLVRNPAAPTNQPATTLDIASWARIVTWDPKKMAGTKASRVEEMPDADLFPERELSRSGRGTYVVPLTNGIGCIGLQWNENRRLRQLGLQFAGPTPRSESVQLQLWSGESAWQGQWQPADVAPERAADHLVWKLGFQKAVAGTQKARWVFSDANQPVELSGLFAHSRSRWQAVDLRLESTRPDLARKAELEIYNGLLLDGAGGAPDWLEWDGAKPLQLKVLSSVPQAYKADRTVMRFKFPATAFGIALEDLLANEAVYVPHAGLFATRLPAPATSDEYRQKIAGRSTVLQEVRRKSDQDFSHAWAAVHLLVADLEPTMLSLACDNRKFIVRRDGALGFEEYNHPDDTPLPGHGGSWLAASQWQLLPRFGSGSSGQVTRRLQGGWLPMPQTTVREGSLVYRQTTYVAPVSDAAPGEPAWLRERAICVVEFTISNESAEPADARLGLSLVPGRAPTLVARLQEAPAGWFVATGERVLALLDTRRAAPLAQKPAPQGLELSGRLAGQAEARCTVCLPAWKVAPADYPQLLEKSGPSSDETPAGRQPERGRPRPPRVSPGVPSEDGEDAAPPPSAVGPSWALATERYWQALLEPTMQIETPDPFLNNIIRASQVHCAIAARNQARGARIAPWIASASYGPLESEANSIIRGMDMLGHGDFARRSLEYFLRQRDPAGFITTGYTLVGTGEFLWTLGEHYERTRDRQWLQRLAPDLVPICQWISRQRARTKRLDAHGQKVPEYGLMPPGVTADWNRFAYRFFNDAQYCAGLEAAGRALADIGDPAAAGILEDARQYRADLARAYHWTQSRTPVVPLADGTWVPGDPALLNCFGRVEDFLPGEDAGRTWCYSIEAGAHHLAATGVLEPSLPEVAWITDWLEDAQFLRSGWPDYPEASNRQDGFDLGGFAKLQPYYCRIAEVYALRDEVKPFIRSYFNTIPSLLNAENLSFCEHFHNYGAWNKTHETGWFLCQTRTMFVTEHGDKLWLAPFVPSRWLGHGLKVEVRYAPTRFGLVSYLLQSSVARRRIQATVQLPEKLAARNVILRLRHPEEKPILSVRVQGQPHADFDPRRETITLPPAAGTFVIEASY